MIRRLMLWLGFDPVKRIHVVAVVAAKKIKQVHLEVEPAWWADSEDIEECRRAVLARIESITDEEGNLVPAAPTGSGD